MAHLFIISGLMMDQDNGTYRDWKENHRAYLRARDALISLGVGGWIQSDPSLEAFA
jgi:hypothetical protein